MAKMNRSQRRLAAKKSKLQKAIDNMPPGQAARVARMCQQGISPDDLKRNFDTGFNNGFKAAAAPVIRSHYAATVLAAHELFGFGAERCARLLNRINDLMVETLTSEEMTQRAFDEVGVEIDWSDPFEKARKREKTA